MAEGFGNARGGIENITGHALDPLQRVWDFSKGPSNLKRKDEHEMKDHEFMWGNDRSREEYRSEISEIRTAAREAKMDLRVIALFGDAATVDIKAAV